MKKFLDKIRDKRVFLVVILFCCIFLFFIGNFALAGVEVGEEITQGVGLAIATVLSWIAYVFIMVFGGILTLLITILVNIAQVNNIIDVPAVVKGWVIVRDLCNMIFVLIFLMIAFATILKIESYNVKKMLPKLLIMAVLINFSRTIFGLMIDFSQVIMLTFVSSFSEHGDGNFIAMFQTDKVMAMWGGAENVSSWPVVVAIITGVIALIITNIVVLVMLAILVMRIVMFWIYTIFSPLIFLGFAFPPIQKYTGKIWEDFTKQLVVGPVLAFFIWLALATASESSNKLGAVGGEELCSGINQLFCEGSFQTFIITVGLLMGGLMVAQQMGGAAGSIAGKGLENAKKVAMAPLKGAQMGIGALTSWGVDTLHEKKTVDLNLPRVWRELQKRRADRKDEKYARGVQKAGRVMAEGGRFRGLMAMTGAPGHAWDQITTEKGARQRLKGGEAMAKDREKYQEKINEAKEPMNNLIEDRSKVLTTSEAKEKINPITARMKDIELKLLDKKEELQKAEDIAHNTNDPRDDRKVKDIKNDIDGLNKEYDQNYQKVEDMGHMIDDDQAQGLDEEIAIKKKEWEKKKEEFQPKIDENIPMYAFEARAAENAAVSKEGAKIKDVDDAQELVRMLQEAIATKEKDRVKAITKKLTADYNDNEAFEALVPEAGSGYKGLQELMRQLSTKGSANYAGFDEQEAMTLGAQVAEMNKRTNHWEASAAYVMENGNWRDATDEEHVRIASTELGKIGPRGNMANNNRLAYGEHIVIDGENEFRLTDIGLMQLESFDNKRMIDRLGENMTESAAQYLAPEVKKLVEKNIISDELADAIIIKAGKSTNFEARHKETNSALRDIYDSGT